MYKALNLSNNIIANSFKKIIDEKCNPTHSQMLPLILKQETVCQKTSQKFVCKFRLSYKKDYKIYPWVYCISPNDGMLCHVRQRFGTKSATRGAWTVKRVTDWNHATEMLKQHNDSKGHKDGVVSARMADQAKRTLTLVGAFKCSVYIQVLICFFDRSYF